jgi:hypothetical protein
MDAALLIERDSPFPIPQVGRLLAFHFGLHPADAIARVRYGGGILVENAPREPLLEIQARLLEAGVRTVVIDSDLLYAVPRGQKAVAVEFLEEGLLVRRSTGPNLILARDGILALHLYGLLPAPAEAEAPAAAGAAGSESLLSPRARQLTEKLAAAGFQGCLLHVTIYSAEACPVRIARDDFQFSCLGEQKQPHSLDNFLILLDELLAYLPEAWNREPAARFLADLEPAAIIRFKEEEVRNFDRWMLHCVRLERERRAGGVEHRA